jgi:ATP-dependent DNA ligase
VTTAVLYGELAVFDQQLRSRFERGYEGLVAKDEASVYVGGRTRAWLKVKQPNWTEGEDRWRRTLARGDA